MPPHTKVHRRRGARHPRESASPYQTNLRFFRLRAGLTQGEVASLLGVHQATISEAEEDRRAIGYEKWEILARLFSTNVNQLIYEETPHE